MTIIIPLSISGERLTKLEEKIKVTDNDILRNYIFSLIDKDLNGDKDA